MMATFLSDFLFTRRRKQRHICAFAARKQQNTTLAMRPYLRLAMTAPKASLARPTASFF